jgi:hypothetical protein
MFNSKVFFHALRTSVPSLGTDVLFQLFNHATHDPFSHSASFRPHTVTCRALPHSLGTPRRRSFPPLNLHRARVPRKSRAASFKSLYRKCANTPCTCRRIALRPSDTTLRLIRLIPPTSAKNDCTRRSRTWYTGVPRRVFYVFNFVKLRLAVRCRARQRIRLHKRDRAGLCRRTELSLKVGCREV